jgi:hypothetical protein
LSLSQKKTIIKPIFKKGDKLKLSNYRPIALIPILSKIYERAMYMRVEHFLESNKILKAEQNGFRKRKSTTLACYQLNDHITKCIDRGTPVAVLFLDMSKAFDTVCHELLLNKLYKYGIRGPAYSWLESYLTNRQQCTQLNITINNKVSTFRSKFTHNFYGVPQGSTLGPLLFIAYINDLPDSIKHDCILFADDTTIIIEGRNLDIFENNINQTLNDVIQWLDNNHLQINLGKTKLMQFKSYRSPEHHLNIEHNLNAIEEVKSTTFLGVTLDSNCNWREHVDMVCKKVNKFLFALWRLKQTVSLQTALIAYHGYILSVLRYGIILWGNSVDSNRVFIVQKKCIRTLCGVNYRESCRPLFQKLNLLTFPCLYIFEIAKFVKVHIEFFDFVDKETTRPQRKYRLALPADSKLVIRNKSAHNMCIKVYNKLPPNLKTLSDIEFKNKLYKMLCDACFYSVNDFFGHKF